MIFRRFALALTLLPAGLAGCATAPEMRAECREMLVEDGGVMRFCEDGSRLSVEALPTPAARPGGAKLIDDPLVLRALSREARARANISPAALAGAAKMSARAQPALVCAPVAEPRPTVASAALTAPVEAQVETPSTPADPGPDNAAMLMTSRF